MVKSSTSKARRLALADQLHSAAIHLLRDARAEDPKSGLTPARLSLLSVLVYAGPLRIGELAEAEQVQPPTVSRLVDALERDGLATRAPHSEDRRATSVSATKTGRELLERARKRRLDRVVARLGSLDTRELNVLEQAAAVLAASIRK